MWYDRIEIYLSTFGILLLNSRSLNVQSTVLRFIVRLFKKLRHCSKLINCSPCKMSAPPLQRDWSHRPHPLVHPSQASVLLPVPPHQVQWNYTNYGGGVLREIPSPPPPPSLPPCVCRIDTKGWMREVKGTSPTSRKGNGSEAMKRWLRKTWETIDRKARGERRRETGGKGESEKEID